MENMKWLREGTLVYTVRSVGYRKGKEVFENDQTIRVQGRGKTLDDVYAEQDLAKRIQDFLNAEEASDER